MKKIFTLFAALAMVMSMSAAKLYLTPNSNWNQSNARFAAYFFGNGDKWISMTKVAGETNLYEVEAPAGYPNVIFCRMNPSSSANNWNNDVKWNQTNDLTIPKDGKNHYTVKAGTWDKGGGEWTIWPVPTAKNYVDVTITVTANAAASIKWHSAGDKLANATDYVAMNAGENNTYTYTLAQVDDFSGVKYTIKVGDVVSEEQTTSTNVTADFKTLMKQAFLKGSMNEWGDKGKMTIADDYLTASIVLSLNAGSYEWKMYVGVDWLGGGKTVTRENNTHKLTDGDNCKLTADIKGNYTFTWTYATNTLTVTYPALPVKYNVTVTAENGTVEGAGEYEEGKEATLTATAAEGYEFVNWTKGEEVVSTENPYKFTVTADVALVANFKKSVQTITLSYDITAENIGNRQGRQTISVEDENYGNPQLVIPGFSVDVAEYTEAFLSINDETLNATATYTNDNGQEVYTATATTADGSIIYNVTFNVVAPAITEHTIMNIEYPTVTVEDFGGSKMYIIEGEAVMDTEDNVVNFNLTVVPSLGFAEGGIGTEIYGSGEATMSEPIDGEVYVEATLTDDAGNIYNFFITIEAPEEEEVEVEIVIANTVKLDGYQLELENQGNMATVSAKVNGIELSFWLTLNGTENGYGTYEDASVTNVWYTIEGEEQKLTPYGNAHVYSAESLIVSCINTPDAEGNVTLYQFTLYKGEKPEGPATALDNLNTTVAPVKMIENGQLIIVKDGVQYNAQGAVIK